MTTNRTYSFGQLMDEVVKATTEVHPQAIFGQPQTEQGKRNLYTRVSTQLSQHERIEILHTQRFGGGLTGTIADTIPSEAHIDISIRGKQWIIGTDFSKIISLYPFKSSIMQLYLSQPLEEAFAHLPNFLKAMNSTQEALQHPIYLNRTTHLAATN